jgi:hypothetical protein
MKENTMRHLNSLRLVLGEALFVLVLLALMFPAPIFVVADAGYEPSNDKDKGDRRRPRDPCEKAPKNKDKAAGNHNHEDSENGDEDSDDGDDANELRRRCEAVGTGGGAAKGDFNGDGFADLAVGVPNEDAGGVEDVGAVNIIYGSVNGLTGDANLTARDDQVLYEGTFGISFLPGDHFGSALAAGRFNGDSFSDLAIGIPDRNEGGVVDAGMVLIIDGSANGLDPSTVRTLSLDEVGRAGAALVWADFNGDTFGDLAVGIPDAEVRVKIFIPLIGVRCASQSRAGEVQVFYGGPNGLTTVGKQRFHQGTNGGCESGEQLLGNTAETSDRFGSVLAAGNFRQNSPFADLVVGVPREDLGGAVDAGLVHLIGGASLGLGVGAPRQIITQNTPGVALVGAKANDQFGRALATGDFDGDHRDDLVVGVPFEDLNGVVDAGAVRVFFGSLRNEELITTDDDLFITEDSLPLGIFGVGTNERFGWALAVGRFDSDDFDDLAIGSPGESFGTLIGFGMVTVFYGSPSGFTRPEVWTKDLIFINGFSQEGDQFGYALSAWNYGKGQESDLAIGAPFDDLFPANTPIIDAGAVYVIYGSPTGLDSTGIQVWHQDTSGIKDAAEPGDHFGQVLY